MMDDYKFWRVDGSGFPNTALRVFGSNDGDVWILIGYTTHAEAAAAIRRHAKMWPDKGQGWTLPPERPAPDVTFAQHARAMRQKVKQGSAIRSLIGGGYGVTSNETSRRREIFGLVALGAAAGMAAALAWCARGMQ